MNNYWYTSKQIEWLEGQLKGVMNISNSWFSEPLTLEKILFHLKEWKIVLDFG